MLHFNKRPQKDDGTSDYSISLDKEYTVFGFILTVVSSRGDEYGRIEIIEIDDGKETLCDYSCVYENGNLLSLPPLSIRFKKVITAWASGGAGRMDYRLTISKKHDII